MTLSPAWLQGASALEFPAGRISRFIARLLDDLMLVVLFWPCMAVVETILGPVSADDAWLIWLTVGASVMVAFAVLQSYPLWRSGQTWGKRLIGIRAVDEHGQRPGLFHSLILRELCFHGVAALPFVGAAIALIDPLLIFREDRRCAHDLLARTHVVTNMTPAALAAHERP
jgi:uncharacterized RDD family membrane protein YckC